MIAIIFLLLAVGLSEHRRTRPLEDASSAATSARRHAHEKKLNQTIDESRKQFEIIDGPWAFYVTSGAGVLTFAIMFAVFSFFVCFCYESCGGACCKSCQRMFGCFRCLLLWPFWMCGYCRGGGGDDAYRDGDRVVVCAAVGEKCRRPLAHVRNHSGTLSTVNDRYCDVHQCTVRGEYAKELEAFERRVNTKYVSNYHWLPERSRIDASQSAKKALISRAVDSWHEHPNGEAGYIYLFTSTFDGERPRATTSAFFYKIGETRVRDVKMRLSQLNKDGDVVFLNQTGKDVWPVNDARAAEMIVHARLCDKRFERFNSRTRRSEIEWFFVSYDTAKEIIEKTVGEVNNH
jgi:T5orf172 domain